MRFSNPKVSHIYAFRQLESIRILSASFLAQNDTQLPWSNKACVTIIRSANHRNLV